MYCNTPPTSLQGIQPSKAMPYRVVSEKGVKESRTRRRVVKKEEPKATSCHDTEP